MLVRFLQLKTGVESFKNKKTSNGEIRKFNSSVQKTKKGNKMKAKRESATKVTIEKCEYSKKKIVKTDNKGQSENSNKSKSNKASKSWK